MAILIQLTHIMADPSKLKYRIDPDEPFSGPHQTGHVATSGAELPEAGAAMILVHGRGASAESILTLADDFDEPDIHYAAPQASQFTWYPYSFLEPTDRNQPGLNSGLQVIYDLMTAIEKAGIPKEKIILAGFSQGACLASEFAARHPARYGGVVALSGGLIGDSISPESYTGDLEETPVFLGCSDSDPHIPVERVHQTEEVFNSLNGNVTKKIYPGMPHTVIRDEIEHVKKTIINAVRS